MKELKISIVLFILVILLVVVNAFYVNSTMKRLAALATEATKSASPEALSELFSYWETNRDIVSLSANLREIDSVTENLLSLKVALEEQDVDRINQSYVLLCNALDDVSRYERLSFGTVF